MNCLEIPSIASCIHQYRPLASLLIGQERFDLTRVRFLKTSPSRALAKRKIHKTGTALIFVVNRRMNKSGPIVLIDDDQDDLQLLIEIFADLNLPNEVHLFKTAESALSFLRRDNVHPFFIISDINMPKMSGFQFREVIRNDAELNRKRIPFMFFTTASTLQVVADADDLSIQGVFMKPSKAGEWHQTLKTIVNYWQLSMSPDQYHL